MAEIKSKNYRKFRIKTFFKTGFKKILQMATLVIIGEYLLLNVLYHSLSEQTAVFLYNTLPTQIVNLAVSEKPILRVAEAYSSIKKNFEFDKILQRQYPVTVRGNRPDFRTLNLQDKEGAKVGYVVKF
jgi:hypothetical protein